MLVKGMFLIFHTSQGMGNLPYDYYTDVVESFMCLFDLKKNQSGQTEGSQKEEILTKIFLNNSSLLRGTNDD